MPSLASTASSNDRLYAACSGIRGAVRSHGWRLAEVRCDAFKDDGIVARCEPATTTSGNNNNDELLLGT
eukprot:NODE_26766_length_538_cov_4.987835.p2 GENE.NODE_26766_length_538_cov_4.987835~~NODE_26766_length_538_cov_4.987835.p2  ORF type:complete len:69 (-),score=14.89 NODE_26766_length_538_cov_4.987835:298-504(-)